MGKTGVRLRLMQEQGGFCAYCFNKMTMRLNRPNTCTRDHVKPRSHGGENGISNEIGCCYRCNHEKADKSLVIFLLNRRKRNAKPI